MNRQPYDGLARTYDANRAGYPHELLVQFAAACPSFDSGGLVLDVGCGTGIATRGLRAVCAPAVRLVGLEPGEDMRRTAVLHAAGLPNLAFVGAAAEALPFGEETAAGVFAAQALHWFDRPAFYAEAARVLRRGGALGVIQNNRDWRSSPFLADYEALLERCGEGYSRDYRTFAIAAELQAAAGLGFERQTSSRHVLTMPQSAFVPWSFSSTKMQACVARVGRAGMRGQLEDLVGHYFEGETAVTIPYLTELYLARRV